MPRLNSTQRRLIQEIERISELFNLDPRKIVSSHEPESWTPRLQLARNQLIRSQILMDYTLVDEYLNMRAAHLFFGKKRSFQELCTTKRFQLFNYHILEALSLLKKLQLVRAAASMPNAVRVDIERLNSLRNGIAHAFFPGNLKSAKPVWKGKSIFSLGGVLQYQEDMRSVFEYFWPGISDAVEGQDQPSG